MDIQLKIIAGLFLITWFTFWFFSRKEQKDWYEQLPHCPCTNPDRNDIQLKDGWAKDIGNIDEFHKGSTKCFRSYPAIKTSAGLSGQQCCYDAEGRLITCGAGAGTPDKVSTCLVEDENGIMVIRYVGLVAHYIEDVLPFKMAGLNNTAWKKYNLKWVPDKGKK
jgi:hypothetical protein